MAQPRLYENEDEMQAIIDEEAATRALQGGISVGSSPGTAVAPYLAPYMGTMPLPPEEPETAAQTAARINAANPDANWFKRHSPDPSGVGSRSNLNRLFTGLSGLGAGLSGRGTEWMNAYSNELTGKAAAEEARQKLAQDRYNQALNKRVSMAQLAAQGSTKDIKDYQFAVSNDGYKGSFEKWMADGGGAAAGDNSYIKTVKFMEDRLGRPLNQSEMWQAMYAPKAFNYGDVPMINWGGQTNLAVGGGGMGQGGGVSPPPMGEQPGAPGALPPGGPAVQPTARGAGVPGDISGQQRDISMGTATRDRYGVEQKDVGEQNAALRKSVMDLEKMDARMGRWNDMLGAINRGEVDAAGWPIGTFGKFYDPETAVLEMEGNIATLEALSTVNLVPMSDADIQFLKSQFMDALKNPAANEAVIKRGMKLMEENSLILEDKADYMYNVSPIESLEGYDRYVLERRKKKRAESQSVDRGESGAKAKWGNRKVGQ